MNVTARVPAVEREHVLREALRVIANGQCPPDAAYRAGIGDLWWQRVAREALSVTRPEPDPSTSGATPLPGRGAMPQRGKDSP